MSKLVRDRIPEIIRENDGREPNIHVVATQTELLDLLIGPKLTEEIGELRSAEWKENISGEIADCMEVLLSIGRIHGLSREDIESVRLKKYEKRWGFEKGIILE